MLVCSFWAGTKRKGVNGGRCPVLTARFRRFQFGCNHLPAPSARTLRKVVEGMNGNQVRGCGGAGVRYSM